MIDDVSIGARVRKEADTLGNTTYDEQYENGSFLREKKEEESATITYIDRWHQDGQGNWIRDVKTFDLSNLEENLKDFDISIFDGVNKEVLKYAFGEPISSDTDKKKSISEEEKNALPYLKATLYYIDYDKQKKMKESKSVNAVVTLLYIIGTLAEGTLVAAMLISPYRKEAFDWRDEKISDIDELIRRLELDINEIKIKDINQKILKKDKP